MAIATDERPASTGVQRGRGGFMRGGVTGDTPWVTDPSGATVKSGARKGQPKRVPYGSPSGRGKQIENSFALEKYGERRLVLGAGIDPDVAAECVILVGLDPDGDEFKAAADRLVVRLKDVAETNLAAERGTHGHALTEQSDEGADWLTKAGAGELLGLDVDVQRSLVEGWAAMLERDGLEVLAVEASCVDDRWRLAGTLDRIARTTRPLRFAMATGEIVEIPAGTVLILDIKTGRRRCNQCPKGGRCERCAGTVMYWQSYSVQIASYAQSVPYDTVAETRGVWPWPISQDHALIAHLDVLAAIAGEPRCELVYVDLAQGRAAGDACEWAHRVWDAQNTSKSATFSVAQLAPERSESEGAATVDPTPVPREAPAAAEEGALGLDAQPVANPSPPPDCPHDDLQQVGRCVYCRGCGLRLGQGRLPRSPEARKAMVALRDVIVEQAEARQREAELAASGTPSSDAATVAPVGSTPVPAGAAPEVPTTSGASSPLVDVVGRRRAPVADAEAAPPAAPDQHAVGPDPRGPAATIDPTDRVAVVAALGGPTHTPDEGADLTGDPRWDDLQGTYLLLDDPQRTWIQELIHQANVASLRINASRHRTERRFHIYRGAIALATAGADDAEILRGLVALALDSDAALFPAITVGHAVGAMDAAAAIRFAELVDDYLADRLSCLVGPDDAFLRFTA